MYLILNKSSAVINVNDRIIYAKTQANGATVATEAADATAVYTDNNDTFYPLQEYYLGAEVYHVAEVDTTPEDINSRPYTYAGGEFVPLPEPEPVPAHEELLEAINILTGGRDDELDDIVSSNGA